MNNNIFATLVLEQNPAYVDELEAKYNIQLPPIFKAFVQTFEFGKFNPSPQHLIIHPNKDLGYDGFTQTLERKFSIYQEQGEYFQKDKMMPFASSGIYGSGICVCLNDENKDKIFINTETIENKFEPIATNILQFISELKEVHWDSV
jgi:hypothetical protein